MTDCPHCEYNKKRAQIWRDEVYRLGGHPLPERKKEWVGLTHGEVADIYEAVMKADVAELVDNFACALEIKLKDKNT